MVARFPGFRVICSGTPIANTIAERRKALKNF